MLPWSIFSASMTAAILKEWSQEKSISTRAKLPVAAIISGAYVDDPKVTDATVGSLSGTTNAATTIAAALVARTSDTINYGPLQNVSELIGKWKAAAACAPPSGVSYSPTKPANSWGIDLPSPDYKDGKLPTSGSAALPRLAARPRILVPPTARPPSMPPVQRTLHLETSMSQVQRFREATIRALASVGQTRVWNLMIDVVAQTGRYPSSVLTSDPKAFKSLWSKANSATGFTWPSTG